MTATMNHQSRANETGSAYERAVEAHLVAQGATVVSRHREYVDLVVRWPDGSLQSIECKADGSKGGLACSRSAKEAGAMARRHFKITGRPVTIYSGKIPESGLPFDLVRDGIDAGELTEPVLFVP